MGKIKRAPDFLKEISTDWYKSQGDNSSEWDYASSPNGSAREDWNSAQANGNYLGWWGRRSRPVFYFGDNNRRDSDYNLWKAYDWYKDEARRLNNFIGYVNAMWHSLEGMNFGSVSHFSNPIEIRKTVPHVVYGTDAKNTVGIKRWLDNKANEANRALREYETQIEKYNEQVRAKKQEYLSTKQREDAARRAQEYAQKVREKNEEKKYWDDRFKNVESRLDGIVLKLGEQDNALKKKDADFSFLKSDLSGISKQQDLISQAPSVSAVEFGNLASDVNSIKNDSKRLEKDMSLKTFNISLDVEKLRNKTREDFGNLSIEFKEALDKNAKSFTRDMNSAKERVGYLEKDVLKIQAKIDENSKFYESEKQKLQGEIDALKGSNENVQPRIKELQSKLINLEKYHDKVKTDLLGALKEHQHLNQTRFEEIEKKNAEQGKVYEKNEEQLRRELVGYKEKANVKFKTLFEYNAYVNKKIQDENKRKRTTLGAVRSSAQPDLTKKVFAGLSRGRFFDLFVQPAY